jgi:nucleotide-binding universal stress UspA family protein
MIQKSQDATVSNKLLSEAKSLFANVDIEVETKSLSGDSVEELIKYQTQNNLDVIAMGAYSHNRFRSVIFGSFTTQMLLNSKKPLFLFR